jgi:Skp family chaperone for outer membrane proteins|tara:strand:- start:1516 stop:2070 length:555 start_codon:yes stop_codon:yes gene_type:complete
MQKTFFLIIFTFFFTLVQSQEKTELKLNNQIFKAGIGVVDMKKILAQSTAYQALVDDFEEKRRKHRNLFTKQEDVVRDEESKLLKQKNILSKEVYAQKIKDLNKKINELKSKQAMDAQKFEREFEISTNKIQGALVDVLSSIASKNELDLVLAKSQLLLVGKDIDLTDQAIKELNKILPKISKN